jgi:hypothetical protein
MASCSLANLLGIPQLLQLIFDGLLRLSADGRALVQHGLDTLLQSAHAPMLYLGHLEVKIAFEGVVHVHYQANMRP